MALTEFDRSTYSRCAIITLHTVLPDRPLPLNNFEQALGSLSERVERGPELIQPRVKVVQVSGARGRRCRENAGGWSRGAGLRTVFESLYSVAMRIRLKTIEAWWLARQVGRQCAQRTRAIPTQSARADAGQVMVGHRGRAGAAAAIQAVRLSQLGSSAKRWFVATG